MRTPSKPSNRHSTTLIVTPVDPRLVDGYPLPPTPLAPSAPALILPNMKAIIDHLLYDTRTAALIASRECDAERLYITKKGRFFTVQEGYPEHTAIAAIDEDSALHWCETSQVPVDRILQFFEVEEA